MTPDEADQGGGAAPRLMQRAALPEPPQGDGRATGKPAGTPLLPVVHWGEAPSEPDAVATLTAPLLHACSAARSGGALHSGAMAFSDGKRSGLHVLVRGFGDGVAGAQAARVVTDRLGRVAPGRQIEDVVAEVKGALGNADIVLRMLTQESHAPIEASVVVLLAAGQHCAVLWAGDLRCYLLRDGLMRCLTRDHIEIGLQHRLSRSVGGGAQFVCDIATDDLLVGDRFLLVGADVVKAVGERRIAGDLADSRPEDIPGAVLDEALIAGARGELAAIAIAAR